MNSLDDTQRSGSQTVLFILRSNPTERTAIHATTQAHGIAATEPVRQRLRLFTVRWLPADA